jgi:hypothetical protein
MWNCTKQAELSGRAVDVYVGGAWFEYWVEYDFAYPVQAVVGVLSLRSAVAC